MKMLPYVAGLCVAGMFLMLPGCGGGGGGGAETADDGNAVPQDAGGFAVPVDTSATPGHFRLVQGFGSTTKPLAIVDTSSGQVVKVLSGYGYGTPANDRYVVDAAGVASPHLGSGYAYLTKDGKVLQFDLSGTTLPEPKQVSSIANACYTSSGWDLAPDGKHQWFKVTTPAPGKTCADLSGYLQYYVASDMPTSQAPLPAWGKNNPTGVSVEGVLTDKQGISKGLLMLDMGTGRLYVASNDMRRELYSVMNNFITSSEQSMILQVIPGAQKGVMLAGNRLYVANWGGGKLVLSAPMTLTASNPFEVSLTVSSAGLYLVDKASVFVVTPDADQAVKLADLDPLPAGATSGYIQLFETRDALVMLRNIVVNAITKPGVSLINKATGKRMDVDSTVADTTARIVGKTGNALLVERPVDDSINVSIELYDVTSRTFTVVAKRKSFFSGSSYVQTKNGWLDKSNASTVIVMETTDATGMWPEVTFTGYDLSTLVPVSIGTIPHVPVQSSPVGYGSIMGWAWAAEPVVYGLGDDWWLFDANKAGSLVKLTEPVQ